MYIKILENKWGELKIISLCVTINLEIKIYLKVQNNFTDELAVSQLREQNNKQNKKYI